METLLRSAAKLPLRAYFSLMKPGIIMGNVITAAAGFALASKGPFDFGLFFLALAGLSLIIGSASACNNYIDRAADQKMARTQNRPLARGVIASRDALLFAALLGLAGALLLGFLVNVMTAAIALAGFIVYVLLYSFLKYHSTHATLVGSIAGAAPPVVGYCAVSNHLDRGALFLFLMVALWQMPHFFAIAIYRLDEYAAAGIPVLPVKKGIHETKIQMVLYVAAFAISSMMLALVGYTGWAYGIVAGLLGIAWLCLSLQGFRSKNDKLWARKMFIFSLAVITVLSFALSFSI